MSIRSWRSISGPGGASGSERPSGKAANRLVCAPAYLVMIPLAPWLFRLAGHEPDVAALETLFFQVSTLGAGAEIMAASFSSFFTGLGHTRRVMVVDTLATIVNGVLDYGWIFGHWGLPALGIEGAAWATRQRSGSAWRSILPCSCCRGIAGHTGSGAAGGSTPRSMRRLLRYGAPSGLQFVVEVAGFTLFLLVLGTLGRQAMAATNLAFNLNVLAFMPMIGLGIASSTLVGHELGRDRPELASAQPGFRSRSQWPTWSRWRWSTCWHRGS